VTWRYPFHAGMLRRRETTMFPTETALDLTIARYLQLRRSLGRKRLPKSPCVTQAGTH
jgi:hypothetical protein